MIYHILIPLPIPLSTIPVPAFPYLCCLIPFAGQALRGQAAPQQQTNQQQKPAKNPPPAQNPPPKQNNPFENVPEAPQKPNAAPTPPPAVTPGVQEAKPAPVG